MSAALPVAAAVERGAEAAESVTLDYAGRFLRRRRLETDGGRPFLVDLPKATSLEDGDCLALDDGTRVAVRAAAEPLLAVTGDLVRAAWHIGNRHTPCRIEADRLLIREDPVMVDMLARLGLEVAAIREPFAPERGAYGHGRTHGHDHGDHSHG